MSNRIIDGRAVSLEPWYNTYTAMMQRCYNPKAAHYDIYGGRGITVCDEWHDVLAFEKWAIESGYKKGLSIDRIDVDGNYEPSNCRWATAKEQANNRRDTVYETIDGITKTLTEWAEFSGINRATINSRYVRGVRGVMLLHRTEDTKFKKGFNRYGNSRHYQDYTETALKNNKGESE